MPKFSIREKKENEKQKIEEEKKRRLTKEELEEKRHEVKRARALLSWNSPARVFRRRGRRYFVTAAILAFLFALMAVAILREYLLVGVILSVLFVAYVLALVSPEEVEHKITPYGLVSAGHAYIWDDLKSFWFRQKNGLTILEIQTQMRWPGQLFILLEGVSKETIKNLLGKHLSFKEIPEENILDKWAHALAKKLPLE